MRKKGSWFLWLKYLGHPTTTIIGGQLPSSPNPLECYSLACLFYQNLNWRNTLKNWAPRVLVVVGHFMVGLTCHRALLPFELLYICILSLFMRYFLHSVTLTLFSITFLWCSVSITFHWPCRVCGIWFYSICTFFFWAYYVFLGVCKLFLRSIYWVDTAEQLESLLAISQTLKALRMVICHLR
jgi:hypothetical protein